MLSKIFKWYGEDFEPKFGSLDKFLSIYLGSNPSEKELIALGKTKKEYLKYDWNLNEIKE